MKKKRLLLFIFALTFLLATLCLVAACTTGGGGGGGGGGSSDGRTKVNKPFSNSNVVYLHFVKEDGTFLFDYQLDNYYDPEDLQAELDAIDQIGYKPGKGYYNDGTTEFSTDEDAINDYIVYHESDITIEGKVFLFTQEFAGFTVTMHMEPITYNVTFDGVEDAEFDGPSTYNVTMYTTPLPIPSKPYYAFRCWYTTSPDEPKTRRIHTNYSGIGGDIVYHAWWMPKTLNLIYETEGVLQDNVSSLTQLDGTYTLKPIADTEAYKFRGWKLNGEYVTQLDPMVLWDDDEGWEAQKITLVADLEFYRHTIKYYNEDGTELTTFEGTYNDWKNFVPPQVPAKPHFVGRWDQEPSEFRDYNIHPIYELEKFTVKVNTGISGYDYSGPTEVTYGATYNDIYSHLSYQNKQLMGLYTDSKFTTRVDEDARIEANCTLYARWSDKYVINTKDDWALIGQHNDAYISIESDINFGFEAIPVYETFNGILEGNNHTVRNFVNQRAEDCPGSYGLFKENKGTIRNLTFSGTCTLGNTSQKDAISLGFLTCTNRGNIVNVTIKDSDIRLTFNHYSVAGNISNSMYGGLFAANNVSRIENCLVDKDVSMICTTNINLCCIALTDATASMYVSYGLIAGSNTGVISHCTSNGGLETRSTYTESVADAYSTPYDHIYYTMRTGGIVGYNGGNGDISDCLSSATIHDGFTLTPKNEFFGTVDIGGIVGTNAGEVERCSTTVNCSLSSNANAELHMGGLVGANESNAILRASLAQSKLEIMAQSDCTSYIGGVIGRNSGTVTYCYAKISTVKPSLSNSKMYFGAIFGSANSTATILMCFASINCSNISPMHCYVGGAYNGAAVRNCHSYVASTSGSFGGTQGVQSHSTEQDLLDTVAQMGFEDMGFTVAPDAYPTLPNAGVVAQQSAR